jgi:hypothetical protein
MKTQLRAPLTKVLTGIQGFDEITEGGLPRGRTTLLMGGPGCGKTVLALQALVNGAQGTKEAGVFVAFEESTHQIIANAATFGWNLPALEKKKLFFLDARLSPERNRALTIVKSRGTGHSNQVRELTLADDGVTLTDVFVAQGKVLMGVARWEWEQEEVAAKKRTQVANELKRLQLQVAQAEAAARLQVVQTEMDARSAEIAVLVLATGSASKLLVTDRAVLRKMRHADDEVHVPKRLGPNGGAEKNGDGA